MLAACLLAGLIGVSLRLPLDPGSVQPSVLPAPRPAAASRIPAGFWAFAAFAVLYGFCETMNGNWSQLDVTSLGVRTATASLALTGFWAAVTAGRLLLAAVQRWLPSRAAYHGLPFQPSPATVHPRPARPRPAPGSRLGRDDRSTLQARGTNQGRSDQKEVPLTVRRETPASAG